MFKVQNVEILPECVPLEGTEEEGYSCIYRNRHVFEENGGVFMKTFRSQPESKTTIELLRTSSVKFADYDCVGEREFLGKNEKGEDVLGDYKYIDYKTFYQRVLAFGRGLLELGFVRGDRIGIYSSNSIWWQTISFGAASVGITIVPIYDSLGPTAAEHIVSHSQMKAIFCSVFKTPNAIELSKMENINLSHLVQMSDKTPEDPECQSKLMNCQEILELGQKSDKPNDFATPEETAVIMYTSGSTGVPKGCVLTQENVLGGAASFACMGVSISTNDTYLSFLPLAHIYAMVVELIGLVNGARLGYTRGIIKYLMEDIQALHPTAMVAVPRVLNRVYDAMKAKIEEKPKILQKIIWAAINAKAAAVKQNRPHSFLLDLAIFKDFRAALGGKMRLIVNGGAPVLESVFDFLAATISPNIIQGYGLTETAAGVAVQEVPVANPATVGACGLACEIRMKKVDGYDVRGKNPAGELQVRGPMVFKGYLEPIELDAPAKDEDGWFSTGDVVIMLDNMQLQIIDRAKQLVKLSQGEYISLTQLSEQYQLHKDLAFAYVYADSKHDFPVAVVTPSRAVLDRWESSGVDSKSAAAHDEIARVLEEQCKAMRMRGFERITRFIIEPVEPTLESGLLTPSQKPQYTALKRKYEGPLLALYEDNE